MLTVATAHYLATLGDTKKGSLTNRHEAAKEHFKNDLKMGLSLAVPAAATGIVIGTGKAAAVATKTGSLTAKVYSMISKALTKTGATGVAKKLNLSGILSKFGNGAKTIATEISKNPKKYGAIGLAVAGGLYLAKVTAKYCNTQGRIDQKYEDAAKIESQTKNVVLEEKLAKMGEKPIFVK